MPANLSPDYFNAEKEYKSAKTPDEKLFYLQKMLSAIPKHKGTEKMQADIKRRISQLKERAETRGKKKGISFRIKPEGAGQISFIGAPNSGKSALLKALTNAEPEVATYPYSTREPLPGMMPYTHVQIQLLDLPPVSREHCESFVFDNIRGSDGALVVLGIDATDPVEDWKEITKILEEKRIILIPPDEEPSEEMTGEIYIRSLLILNKRDIDPDGELVDIIKEMINSTLPLYEVSTTQGIGLDVIAEKVFDLLHIIRVFSKQPGKPADLESPFTAPIGTTVYEFAGLVHKDFAENFKSARIWGSSKFDGQVVQRDYILQDGDIVELSTS